MKRSARRARVEIGIAYLVEVIADVLQEAHDRGNGPLLVEAIKELAAFPYSPRINEVVRGTLNRMKEDGLVDVTEDVEGNQIWRLLNV